MLLVNMHHARSIKKTGSSILSAMDTRDALEAACKEAKEATMGALPRMRRRSFRDDFVIFIRTSATQQKADVLFEARGNPTFEHAYLE